MKADLPSLVLGDQCKSWGHQKPDGSEEQALSLPAECQAPAIGRCMNPVQD